MTAQYRLSGKALSDAEIVDQITTFLLAGKAVLVRSAAGGAGD